MARFIRSTCPLVRGWLGLGQAMPDLIGLANRIEAHFAERDAAAVPPPLRELYGVVCQDRADPVRHEFKKK